MRQKTLRWYLARWLFALFGLFSLIWIWVASQVYHYAWDGTSEYYLYQDLEVALSGQLMLPYEDGGKLMGNWQDLPTDYQQALSQHGLGPEAKEQEISQLLTLSDDYLYTLRYTESAFEPLYIIHRISGQDSPSLVAVFIALTLALLILAAVTWWPIHRRIARESGRLTASLQIVSLQENETQAAQFEEFSYHSILAATDAYAQRYAQQQEQLYSAFLSHELNTPLAQIHNTISRFEQLDELPLDALPLLTQLEEAGQDLASLSEAILLLCKADQVRLTSTDLCVFLQTWQQHWQQQGLRITLELPSEPISKPVQSRLLNLLLEQIGKNALQHGEGSLSVSLDSDGMIFTNGISTQQTHQGQGLGTRIVSRVCACFGWQAQHKPGQYYTLTIHFSGYHGDLFSQV
ncbi:hypothetical protein [Pseudoalteromonas sp. McH1-42]|uniref:sensor histidine kinase n=1 Tax=Pseudoalteromonas sp. McH1-42 TaxID=2917752 RepID=UPI001EF739E4|nr:hypothetical protein [Pseudoalteromonas sp. McH1-42]MCG7561119.1 hypothetical protein [Pseudoalteromonas sp. McH1-42]